MRSTGLYIWDSRRLKTSDLCIVKMIYVCVTNETLLPLNIHVLLDETRDHRLSMRGKASSKNHTDAL